MAFGIRRPDPNNLPIQIVISIVLALLGIDNHTARVFEAVREFTMCVALAREGAKSRIVASVFHHEPVQQGPG